MTNTKHTPYSIEHSRCGEEVGNDWICIIDWCGYGIRGGYSADWSRAHGLCVFGGTWYPVPPLKITTEPSETDIYTHVHKFMRQGLCGYEELN